MVRRDGSRVRCFTRNGNDWSDRFPAIVETASHLRATSFLIDGEAVIVRDDGMPDFHALRSQHRGHEAVLVAFDLIEHDGEDLRDLPLIERKQRLARLIGRTKNRRAIQYSEHLTGNGASVLRLRLPDGAGRHRIQAGGRAVSQRAVQGRGSSRRTRRARRCGGNARRNGVRPAHGHQMHELGSIDVMRLDQTLGQSRHVACASSCMSMRTSLEEGIKLHRFAGIFPEQFLTEAGRHREAVVAADQRMVIRCFRDDLAGFVHDVSHVPPPIQRAGIDRALVQAMQPNNGTLRASSCM